MKLFAKTDVLFVFGALSVLAVTCVYETRRVSGASSQQIDTQDRAGLIAIHQNTSFPLLGKHLQVPCGSCHLLGVVAGTPTTCESCHWGRRQDDPYRLQLGTHCEDCHTSQEWSRIQPGAWEHEMSTGFRLEGMHASLACTDCHSTRSFHDTTAQCDKCHQRDFEKAQEPDHVAANFPLECEGCHFSESTWLGARFDHSTFPIAGPHRTVSCESCHLGGRFAGTPLACVECHRADFESSTEPSHVEAGFSVVCEECHSVDALTWLGAEFDHDVAYPLTGMHALAECVDCHANEVYAGTPADCLGCHRQDYDETSDPNHARAGFPTDCASCHGSRATSWLTGSFDHNSAFPLKGMHKSADCSACHVSGRFTGTPSECVDCHRADYDRTANPRHAEAGFSTSCVGCHGDGATGWLGANFEHDRVFPLRGRHQTVDCAQCHVNGRFAGTPSECVACHREDYQRTTSPNHVTSGFGTDCASCHGTTAGSWAGAGFDHDAFFRLVGNHRAAACTDCHVGGRYAGTSSDCIGCHRDDYDATRNPNHQVAGFGTNCESCHGTTATSWTGANFDHNAFFALRGRHATAECTLCHVGGRYAGTPSDCVGCHRADYDGTTTPRHAEAGFGTDCASCHGNGATTWAGANFDHNAVFPLQGAHGSLDCNTCHARGYNLPRDCYGCHASEYNATRSPNHVNAGFPTTCENCHLPSHTRWTQATFEHGFPINSGPHSNATCNDCHRTTSYFEFSCLECHKHARSTMDEKHREIGGYVYESQACYACHPRGKS